MPACCSRSTPALPSGPAIILVAGVLYAVSVLFGRVGGLMLAGCFRGAISKRERMRAMLTRRIVAARRACRCCSLGAAPALAQDKLKVVATFSILADFVKNVGGDRVEVTALVGPNSDAHVYSPTPADAKKLADAKVVFVNGLGFEGWMTRLVKASGTKAPMVVASKGIKPRKMEDEHHRPAMTDPHAWQSVANAKIYVANIRDALIEADPAGKSAYEANAAAYLGQARCARRGGEGGDRRRFPPTAAASSPRMMRSAISAAPTAWRSSRRRASRPRPRRRPRTWRRIITQIRKQKIPAVFLENITDPRLMERIAARAAPRSAARSIPTRCRTRSGPAATYIDMMRNNVRELSRARWSP